MVNTVLPFTGYLHPPARKGAGFSFPLVFSGGSRIVTGVTGRPLESYVYIIVSGPGARGKLFHLPLQYSRLVHWRVCRLWNLGFDPLVEWFGGGSKCYTSILHSEVGNAHICLEKVVRDRFSVCWVESIQHVFDPLVEWFGGGLKCNASISHSEVGNAHSCRINELTSRWLIGKTINELTN